MPNLAAQIRQQAQNILPGAVVVKRTPNTIVHALGDKGIIDAGLPLLHIPGSNVEINTDWTVSTTQPWLFQQTLNALRAYCMPGTTAFNAGQIYRVESNTGEFISFQPMALNWTNDNLQLQQISIPSAAVGVVNQNVVTYPLAYGLGTEFNLTSYPGHVQKLLTVTSISNLSTPNTTILSGPNPSLSFGFIFQKTPSMSMFLDGNSVAWNETSTITATRVEFKSGGNTVLSFNTGWVEANDGSVFVPTYRFRRQGNSLIVEVIILYSWLQTAAFPIKIDPSVDYQVGASADDREQDTTIPEVTMLATQWLMRNTGGSGAFDWGYTGFNSVTIPNGATIDLANIQLYYVGGGTNNIRIHADDVASSANPATGFNTNISSKPRTTANVTWNGSVSAVTYMTSPDIKTIIQELVDTYSYASGSRVGIIVEGLGSSADPAVATYDRAPTESAKLHIEYTSAAGTQISKPISTIAANAWTTNTGASTNLHLTIDEDEASIDDADFMRSEEAPSASVVVIGMQTVNDPSTGSGHQVLYRVLKNNALATINLTFRLKQGASTTIATWTQNNITTTPTTFTYNLTTGEADAITNYGDLRIEVEATATGGGSNPAFVVATNNSTNNGSSLTLSPGTGAAEGDIAIALISHRGGSSGTITAPGGWTQIGTQQNSGTTLAAAMFWRVLTADDVNPPPPSHDFPFGTSGVKGIAILTVYSNVDSVAPILTSAFQVNASAANIAVPALTLTAQDHMRVAIGAKAHSDTHTVISGWTLDSNATVASGGGSTATRNRGSVHYLFSSSANPPAQTIVSTTNAVSVGGQMALKKSAGTTRARVTFMQMKVPGGAPKSMIFHRVRMIHKAMLVR